MWRDAAARLKRIVRARLPDFQVLVAVRQHAATRAAPSGSGGGEGGEEGAAQAELLLPRILQVVGRYIALFPESLAESRLDLPRLVADPAALASPPALLQTLGLLRAAPPRSGGWLASAKGVSLASLGVHQAKLGEGKKKVVEKGEKNGGKQVDGAVVSYLGVVLSLVARTRGEGSRMTLLRQVHVCACVYVLCAYAVNCRASLRQD